MLLRIPKHRQEDVIIVDPSDTEFPIGFNVLSTETEVEKIVLSSDIVATFKRYATAWGDTIVSFPFLLPLLMRDFKVNN